MGVTTSVTLEFKGDTNGAISAMARLSAQERLLKKEVREAADELAKFDNALKVGGHSAKDFNDRIAAMEDRYRRATKALSEFAANHQRDMMAASLAVKKHQEEMARSLQKGTESASKLGGTMQQLAFGIDDAVQALGSGQGLSGALRGAGNNMTAMAAMAGPLATAVTAVGVAGMMYFARQAERTKEANEELEKMKKHLEELADLQDKAKLGTEEFERRRSGAGDRAAAATARQQAQDAQERFQNARRRGSPAFAMTNAELGNGLNWIGAFGQDMFFETFRRPLAAVGAVGQNHQQRMAELQADAIRTAAARDEADRRVAARGPNADAARQFEPMRPELEGAARNMLMQGRNQEAVVAELSRRAPGMEGPIRDMVRDAARRVRGVAAGRGVAADADPQTRAVQEAERRVQVAQDAQDEIEARNRRERIGRGGRQVPGGMRREEEAAQARTQLERDVLDELRRLNRQSQQGNERAREQMNQLIQRLNGGGPQQIVVPGGGGGGGRAAAGAAAVGQIPANPWQNWLQVRAPVIGAGGAVRRGGGRMTAQDRRMANLARFQADKAAKRARFNNGRQDPEDREAAARARRLAFRLANPGGGGADPQAEARRLRARIARNERRLVDAAAAEVMGEGGPQNQASMRFTEQELRRQTTLLEQLVANTAPDNAQAQAGVGANAPRPAPSDRNADARD